MDSFEPKAKKSGEVILLFGILTVAGGFFAVSYIPGMPAPAFFQLMTFLLMVTAVLLVSNCLMKNFRFDFVLRERANDGVRTDLEITDIAGRNQRVVCRISTSDICAVGHLDDKNFRAWRKNKRVYNYSGNLFFKNNLLLSVKDDEELIYLILPFDPNLFEKLRTFCPVL